MFATSGLVHVNAERNGNLVTISTVTRFGPTKFFKCNTMLKPNASNRLTEKAISENIQFVADIITDKLEYYYNMGKSITLDDPCELEFFANLFDRLVSY